MFRPYKCAYCGGWHLASAYKKLPSALKEKCEGLMYIYVCTDHDGHYPVGVCSVIMAHSETEARGLLKAELHKHGLDENKSFTLRQLSTDKAKAFVLLDGDY